MLEINLLKRWIKIKHISIIYKGNAYVLYARVGIASVNLDF